MRHFAIISSSMTIYAIRFLLFKCFLFKRIKAVALKYEICCLFIVHLQLCGMRAYLCHFNPAIVHTHSKCEVSKCEWRKKMNSKMANMGGKKSVNSNANGKPVII